MVDRAIRLLGIAIALLLGSAALPRRFNTWRRYGYALGVVFLLATVAVWLWPDGPSAPTMSNTILGNGNCAVAGSGNRVDCGSATESSDAAKRLATKDLLGKGISEGEEMLVRWPQLDTAIPDNEKDISEFSREASKWIERMAKFISGAYGEAEARLFLSDAGFVNFTDHKERTSLRNKISNRLQRLNELIARSGSIPMQKSFDPMTYHWQQ